MKQTNNSTGLKLLCSASLLALMAAPASAQEGAGTSVSLPGITVFSTVPQLPSEKTEDPESSARAPSVGDSGEFLRQINGVSAGRMGGHGLDPSIRGLDQNQLSITNDGAFHFGGCPNRMDPPTSHMQLYTYDKVTVKKGYQSVVDGPPAPGGTISFERLNPSFAPGMKVSSNIKIGGGYNSNGKGREAFVDMSMGNDWGYIRGFGSYGAADNYEDGDGNILPSSFRQFGGGIILGRTFDATSWITLKVENNNVDDAKFPGATMDAPATDDWTYQLKGETSLDWGIIKGVKGNIYLTTVDHVMDTFSLRPSTATKMRALMTSDTAGGRIEFNGILSPVLTFTGGLDYRDIMRDGTAYNHAVTPPEDKFFLWPDTSIKELGLFGEGVYSFSDSARLTFGLRYSHVNAVADTADQRPTAAMSQTPNQWYSANYGGVIDATRARTENNFSGLLRLEDNIATNMLVYGSLGRSVRTADTTERYMAKMTWVGNPDIAPEQHHQAELGMAYKGSVFDLSGSVYYNDVTDYIQRYTQQRLVMGTLKDFSTYRNIDATLMSLEARAEIRLNEVFRVNLAGAYTYGENDSDNTALAQVSPLSGKFEFTYDDGKLMAGVRLNATGEQNRIDDRSSRQDYAASKAWATMDLFGSYTFSENLMLSAGVTNLFDKTYAQHLNRGNALDPTPIRVNEPGRSFYIRAVSKF